MTTMANPGMPAAAKREVEGILKMWREIKYQLHVKHDDAIFGGYGSDFEARSRGGRPGNPTQSRAIRLATDPETRQLERLNAALEAACLALAGQLGKGSPQWYAMRMLHLGNHKVDVVAKRLEVSRQTVWRWQQRFQTHLWEQLRHQK
jgi:hypothetical protein